MAHGAVAGADAVAACTSASTSALGAPAFVSAPCAELEDLEGPPERERAEEGRALSSVALLLEGSALPALERERAEGGRLPGAGGSSAGAAPGGSAGAADARLPSATLLLALLALECERAEEGRLLGTEGAPGASLAEGAGALPSATLLLPLPVAFFACSSGGRLLALRAEDVEVDGWGGPGGTCANFGACRGGRARGVAGGWGALVVSGGALVRSASHRRRILEVRATSSSWTWYLLLS